MSTVENNSKFDKLPAPIQALIGLASFVAITAVGFLVFFAFDILLLDFDPIGTLFEAIF
ncbi:hypothetical protein [Treponema pectinovorum]|uniref:hypothetical protein n=1 Tax=Treponema pectinovorum TaxID=164 RepID=UPI00164DA951|nr:hypothetical protein [Treponema pectinovorum]